MRGDKEIKIYAEDLKVGLELKGLEEVEILIYSISGSPREVFI